MMFGRRWIDSELRERTDSMVCSSVVHLELLTSLPSALTVQGGDRGRFVVGASQRVMA
jgi:hypothetical protein